MEYEHPVATLSDVQAAKQRIGIYNVSTPLLYAPKISTIVGTDVYLKCENLQRTGAFKVRGALNMLLALMAGPCPPSGVITASSGNHGQAVAYAAMLLKLPCTVVVPETVLAVKEEGILEYGAKVVRCGTTSPERINLAERLAAECDFRFVPPYDHPLIVAGQGTVGLEIVEQCPDVAAIFVPVGGGGLISGIATAIKNTRSSIRIFGVEPELANDTFLSRQTGRIVDIGETKTIADGLRTSHPGEYTFPIVQEYVDEIHLVSEDDIMRAVLLLLRTSKLLVEPSGATSVAAALNAGPKLSDLNGPMVCVLSGGNADLSMIGRWVDGAY